MTRNIALNIYKHEQVRQEYMEYHMVKSVSSQIDYDFSKDFIIGEMLGIIYSALAAIPRSQEEEYLNSVVFMEKAIRR